MFRLIIQIDLQPNSLIYKELDFKLINLILEITLKKRLQKLFKTLLLFYPK